MCEGDENKVSFPKLFANPRSFADDQVFFFFRRGLDTRI